MDLVQGPLARAFRLGSIRVQTAGYSSTSGATGQAEAILQGVRDFEELKDAILSEVRRLRPVGVEVYSEQEEGPMSVNRAILDEVRRIREALERA